MFSWFNESENKGDNGGEELAAQVRGHISKSQSVGLLAQPSSPSETGQISPTSTVSAHDAVVASMNEKIREIRDADSLANGETLGRVEASAPDEEKQGSVPENVYDPFDGQRIGVMVPEKPNKLEDDLWNHLAHIRTLQSEIAKMHAHMEGLGENERSQVDEEATNADEEVKAAKFAKLGDRFNGRKEAIDAIMTKVAVELRVIVLVSSFSYKLDTLSRAINDFHASRAPLFQYEEQFGRSLQEVDTKAGSMDNSEGKSSRRSVSGGNVASAKQDAAISDNTT